MDLLMAARRLERIADHATNIAEEVIYLVEGKIVRPKILNTFLLFGLHFLIRGIFLNFTFDLHVSVSCLNYVIRVWQ
jgi:hypothetical protein